MRFSHLVDMEQKLEKYRAKRNFAVTGEPEGKISRARKNNLKFSVQRHAARADHFDLRLEYGGVALSWAVPKGPSYSPQDKRLAMRVEDHPIGYMDFEGTIPKGEYGGGTVMLFDEGKWIPRFSPEKGLKEGSLKFFLDGKRLKGNWALVRMEKKDGETSEPWLLIKERDEYAKSSAGISRFTRGVRSGKSMQEIAGESKKNPFQTAEVMLANSCAELPGGTGWLYELKYDGHRTLGFIQDGKAVLKTRNGYDCTASFPSAAKALEALLGDRAAVVDGEMVAVGKDGIPDFSALQAHLRNPKQDGICYVCFDLLALDGEDLRSAPLTERKKKLKGLLAKAEKGGVLSYSEHTERMNKRQIRAVKEKGMEGLVAKRANSPYKPGKNGDWQKLKFRGMREFIVGGYSLSETGGIRSLLLGFYEGEKLKYCGKVGTGFSKADQKELKTELLRLKSATSPFESVPKKELSDPVFVKPELIAQVEYATTTSSGLLRQASFKGLRRDKSPHSVGDELMPTASQKKKTEKEPSPAEKPINAAREHKVCGVLISHPDKVMFPGTEVTKLRLAAYYEAAASRMTPYLKDRILSIVCCPMGIGGEQFFRKHLDGPMQGIGFSQEAEKEDNFYLKAKKGLISLVQYNAVEFHIRGGKKGSEKSDVMVFDLDPDEELPLSEVRRGARELKKTLDNLDLVSFLKTSGGKGYHILVPFCNLIPAKDFCEFSRQVALLMEKRFPRLFTATMSKKVRQGKIFLDWQRNSPKATSVAPYSVRARQNAPVSMPIAWEELSKVSPSQITLSNALKRLEASDPWADFFSVKKRQSLKFPAQ